VKFTPTARSAEEFERALRDGSSDGAYAQELATTSALTALDVPPDPKFAADLRVSLLLAARSTAVAAPPAPRRQKRRWSLVAPAAAVALATGGVAFAVTGLANGGHATPAATPSQAELAAASALSSAHAQLAAVGAELKAGSTDASDLSRFRAQAIRLQQALIAAYASGRNPAAMQDLHDFAAAALAELSALKARVPANLVTLYLQTLQTLVDIATTAETACPTCHLAPVHVPASVAPYVHVPPTPPGTAPASSGSASSTPTDTQPSESQPTGPTAPSAPTPSATVPSAPTPTETPTQPATVPPVGPPTGLPTLPPLV
jgi:hypothetical protein